jgi:hypothetical protein
MVRFKTIDQRTVDFRDPTQSVAVTNIIGHWLFCTAAPGVTHPAAENVSQARILPSVGDLRNGWLLRLPIRSCARDARGV